LAALIMALLVELGVAWLRHEEWLRRDQRFHVQTKRLQEEIVQQVSRVGDLLRAAQVLTLDGRDPDQARWEAFAKDVELEARYPAVRSIQWVPKVRREELAAFEARMRKIHGADFKVWSLPGGREADLPKAEVYFPIAGVHPKALGQRGLGFDVYTRSTTRKQVVDVILQQQTLRLGNKVDLVEEPGTIAFGLTGPIFSRTVGPEEGLQARRNALRGFVTCMFDAKRFFRVLSEEQGEPLAFAVYEGQGPQASGLIWSGLPAAGGPPPQHDRYATLTMYGRTWTLHYQTTPAWEAMQPPGPVGLARTLGYALSLLLGALVAVLLRARERALGLVADRTRELEARNEELRRQSQEHFASERAREELLVIVNHGLRTPLTALRGALAVLGEEPGPAPESRREMLTQATRNAERALILVNDLLDLHRLEQRKLPMEKMEVSLKGALQEAMEGMEGLARAQERPLRLDCPDRLRAVADPRRLQQVLTNLLGNALRHGQRGTPIRLWAEATPAGRIRVSLHNVGEPLSQTIRARLFGAGSFLSSSGPRLPGLGLPIAKGLVEAMGGTMGHVLVEGGNTFWFELPGHD
jgi:signal transduction histidine kinase